MIHLGKSRRANAASPPRTLAVAALGGSLLWIFLSLPTRVWARPSDHIRLELEAPAPCPDVRALLGRIDTQLGENFSTDTSLHVVAHVRALSAGEYELQVDYQTSAGATDERRLRGESCDAVTDAAVLVLAIALNPSATLPDAEPVNSSEPLLSPRVGILVELDTAIMQRVSYGLGVLLGLRFGPVELNARGQLLLPRAVAQGETSTSFSAYSFDLGLCVPWRSGVLVVGPCARAQVGRLSASVEGAVQLQRPGAARFQALALGFELRARAAAPLWLTLGADFSWFLRRPQFVVTDLGEVGRPARFGVRVYVGPLLAW